MITRNRGLLSLTAGDLMSREVITIPEGMSLRAAGRVLLDASISGAPVVNQKGQCIGVLSTRDIVRWIEKRHPELEPSFEEEYRAEWQVEDLEAVPTDEVRSYMTPDPVIALPTATIASLARRMVEKRVHRVIVIAQNGTPVGVLSSMDLLSAIAHEEPDEDWT